VELTTLFFGGDTYRCWQSCPERCCCFRYGRRLW
jgi:hypothetical protein